MEGSKRATIEANLQARPSAERNAATLLLRQSAGLAWSSGSQAGPKRTLTMKTNVPSASCAPWPQSVQNSETRDGSPAQLFVWPFRPLKQKTSGRPSHEW